MINHTNVSRRRFLAGAAAAGVAASLAATGSSLATAPPPRNAAPGAGALEEFLDLPLTGVAEGVTRGGVHPRLPYDLGRLEALVSQARARGLAPKRYAALLYQLRLVQCTKESGIDLATWDPGTTLARCKPNMIKSYNYYRNFQLRHDELQWAGMGGPGRRRLRLGHRGSGARQVHLRASRHRAALPHHHLQRRTALRNRRAEGPAVRPARSGDPRRQDHPERPRLVRAQGPRDAEGHLPGHDDPAPHLRAHRTDGHPRDARRGDHRRPDHDRVGGRGLRRLVSHRARQRRPAPPRTGILRRHPVGPVPRLQERRRRGADLHDDARGLPVRRRRPGSS